MPLFKVTPIGVKTSDNDSKITKKEAEKLAKIEMDIGKHSKDSDLTNRIRLLGALVKVGVTTDELSTLCHRLEITENPEPASTTVVKKLKEKDIEKGKEVATKTLVMLEKFFPNVRDAIKKPDENNPVDIFLYGLASGPHRCRFSQIEDANDLTKEAEKWATGNGPFRSIVTALSGMAGFRDASKPEDGPGGFKATLTTLTTLMKISGKSLSTEDISRLTRFEPLGKKAQALLETTINFEGVETTFKDWATNKMGSNKEQLLAKLAEKITTSGSDDDTVVEIVNLLNQLMANSIELGVKFEKLRNGEDASASGKEDVSVSGGSTIDPKDKESRKKSIFRRALSLKEKEQLARSKSFSVLDFNDESSSDDEGATAKPVKRALLPAGYQLKKPEMKHRSPDTVRRQEDIYAVVSKDKTGHGDGATASLKTEIKFSPEQLPSEEKQQLNFSPPGSPRPAVKRIDLGARQRIPSSAPPPPPIPPPQRPAVPIPRGTVPTPKPVLKQAPVLLPAGSGLKPKLGPKPALLQPAPKPAPPLVAPKTESGILLAATIKSGQKSPPVDRSTKKPDKK